MPSSDPRALSPYLVHLLELEIRARVMRSLFGIDDSVRKRFG